MANPLKFIKNAFLLNLGLLITNQTFSPEINANIYFNSSESKKETSITDMEIKKREKIIEELNKPVSKFYIPVDTGQVSCVYGNRKFNDKTEFHSGIDIGVLGNSSLKFAERPEVLAAASGIVDFAGSDKGYGNVVKIKHNNDLETIYAHLNKFFVKEGDSVLAQQKIGEMGRSGNSRSNKKGQKIHLHFEARKNNKPFNPNKKFIGYEKVGIDDTLYASFYEAKNIEENFFKHISLQKIDQKQPEKIIVDWFSAPSTGVSFFPQPLEQNNLSCFEYENPIKKQPEKINLEKTLEKHYSIQIAASTTNLSERKINEFEKLYGQVVNEYKTEIYKNGTEKVYYKYSIKNFKSLEEALVFRNSLNSDDNLGILVHKDGRLVETIWNF